MCDFAGAQAPGAGKRFVIAGHPGNDICELLRSAGASMTLCKSAADAVTTAEPGGGVLILADGYPNRQTPLDAHTLNRAAEKKLRLYIEFPAFLPGLTIAKPQTVDWERGVVSSDFFGSDLPQLRILSPQNCVFLPMKAEHPHLVLARVAGYNRAVYGSPSVTYPLLFELSPGDDHGAVLIATTKLSQVFTARFAPAPAWETVWRAILEWTAPGTQIDWNWRATVRPAWGLGAPLPNDAEDRALKLGIDWFHHSQLLADASRTNAAYRAANAVGIYLPAPPPGSVTGNGSLGIFEGYVSRIQPDGSQLQSVAIRGDCVAESAMALAFGGYALGNAENAAIAARLLDYWYFVSPGCKGERGDTNHPSFGLSAWGISSPAWYKANYGDDNARVMLATMAAATALNEDRWDEKLLLGLLANLRTTGKLGFRGDRIDQAELTANGWEHYFGRNFTQYAPHFESYLWACYLWAYDKTGFELFRDRAKTAIRMTMIHYPDGWRWTNGLQQERARMLLALAWLVRVEDTAEHRAWLKKVAGDLLVFQDASGAIAERIGALKMGYARQPTSNAEYGLTETPLLQENGDPVSDMLYTCNFAFLGLHEAAAATGDSFYSQAEDRLAKFLCRIQARSTKHPELDGAWFRAFDFELWDYWASNGDAGWGAWSIETGWTQGWITSVLAMRKADTSLWSFTSKSKVARFMDRWRPFMIPDAVLDGNRKALNHAAVGKPVTLANPSAPEYSAGGPAALVDAQLASLDYSGGDWLGFHGSDLEATIDLGKSIPLREIRVSFLRNVRMGIFLPVEVSFLAGEDAASLGLLGVAKPLADRDGAALLRETLSVANLGVKARYVRVVARNLKTVPSFHLAAGKPSWLFVDEIAVNPLPSPASE